MLTFFLSIPYDHIIYRQCFFILLLSINLDWKPEDRWYRHKHMLTTPNTTKAMRFLTSLPECSLQLSMWLLWQWQKTGGHWLWCRPPSERNPECSMAQRTEREMWRCHSRNTGGTGACWRAASADLAHRAEGTSGCSPHSRPNSRHKTQSMILKHKQSVLCHKSTYALSRCLLTVLSLVCHKCSTLSNKS